MNRDEVLSVRADGSNPRHQIRSNHGGVVDLLHCPHRRSEAAPDTLLARDRRYGG